MKIFQNINIRLLSCFFLFCLLAQLSVAKDKESIILTDSVLLGNKVNVELYEMSNMSGSTTHMGIRVYPGDSPIEIKKIEWERIDTVWQTLEPVALTLNNRALNGQRIYWTISFDFAYTETFSPSDRLLVYTDKGIFANFTSENGRLKDDIRKLTVERNTLLAQRDEAQKKSDSAHNLWILFLITTSILLLALIFVIIKSQLNRKKLTDRLLESDKRLASFTARNTELETQNTALYHLRLDTINRLCEDYYEKNESDNLRTLLYNDLKNYILSFKDKKKIEQIRDEVNSLQSQILNRIKEQLPNLSSDDFTLLTYIIGGFSPKAISVLTDINTKQFYYRRQKLLQQILASDAPDKEFFASKI